MLLSNRAVKDFITRERVDWSVYKNLSERDLDRLAAKHELAQQPWSKLRLVQKVMVLAGLRARRLGLWADTGLGKSSTVLTIARHLQATQQAKRVLVLVPRRTNKDEWASEIEKHAPDLTYCLLPSNIADKWATIRSTDALLTVETYAGLLMMATEKVATKAGNKLQPSKKLVAELSRLFDVLVCDECFPRETRIRMEDGNEKPIDSVHVGDRVQSSFGSSRVKRVLRRRSKLMVRIRLVNGSELTCTPNEPFMTTRGWVCAGNLRGHHVLDAEAMSTMRNYVRDLPSTTKILQPDMLRESREPTSQCCSTQAKGDANLQALQKHIYAPSIAHYKTTILLAEMRRTGTHVEKEKPTEGEVLCRMPDSFDRLTALQQVLRQVLLSEMADEAARDPRADLYEGGSRQNTPDLEFQSASPQTTTILAGETSLAGNPPENIRKEQRKKIQESWWKRYGFDKSPSSIATTIRLALESGVRHNIGAEAGWLSNLLQGRSGASNKEVDDRSGWGGAQNDHRAAERSQARCKAFGIGVEDVTFEELASPVDVFDFELEGTPHFFAEGFLVHNSQSVKAAKKLPYRLCRKIAQSTRYVYALSGTPHGRDPIDLWAQMYLIDFGRTLGETLGLYRAAFFREKRGLFGPEYEFDRRKEKLLHKILSNGSIRFEADAASLPHMVRAVKEVPLSREAQAYYDRGKEVFKHVKKHSYQEIRNAFLRLRQISSGFLGFVDDESGKSARVAFADNPKLDLLLAQLESVDPESKVIVFHEFLWSGERIASELAKLKIPAVRMYGGTKDATQVRKSFIAPGGPQVLILQNQFGIGLNLQVAKYGYFFEAPVSPIVRKQCIRRFERQESPHKTVFMYDLVMKGTLDKHILRMLEEGEDLLHAIIDGRASHF